MPDPTDPALLAALAALPGALKDDPELAAKLAQVATAKDRLTALDEKIAILSLDTADKTTELRRAYRDRYATRFADLDVKQALIGFPINHRIEFKDTAAFLIRPPTAKVTKTIEAEVQTLGLRDYEATLLCWLQTVDLGAVKGPVAQLAPMKIAEAAEYLRRFPEALLQRLARECHELANYIDVCLELDLGN